MSQFPYSGPAPAGFGNCNECAYYVAGTVAICAACASTTIDPPPALRCQVCNQTLGGPLERCSNSLCTDPARQFDWTVAIARKTGPLERTILRVKDGKWAWTIIFARVVLGYLYNLPELTSMMNAFIPSPAYLPDGANPYLDHARITIEQAIAQDERGLPFVVNPPLIIKTRPTSRMRATSSEAERRAVGQEIYDALWVPAPASVNGRLIMVYDDVFTSGNTLNAVARRLREAGAAGVYGLTLARQQWR